MYVHKQPLQDLSTQLSFGTKRTHELSNARAHSATFCLGAMGRCPGCAIGALLDLRCSHWLCKLQVHSHRAELDRQRCDVLESLLY